MPSFLLKTIVAILVGLSALALSAASAGAANPPPGSYRQSCVGYVVSGTTLVAICRTENGALVPAQLANYPACGKNDITNIDGKLWCNKGPSPPKGSYSDSCQETSLTGTTLTSICRDRNGNWHITQLTNIKGCQGDITNRDGVLDCVRGNAKSPAGHYGESCTNILVVHVNSNTTIMTASCKRIDGSIRSAANGGIVQLNLDNCRNPVIVENIDGQLSCYMGKDAPPGGSYLNTCAFPTANGSDLQASCLKKNGVFSHSDLSVTNCLPNSIYNDDGVLKCATAPPTGGSGNQVDLHQTLQCANLSVSPGFIIYKTDPAPTCQPYLDKSYRGVWIEEYDKLPVGQKLSVCAWAPVPDGWEMISLGPGLSCDDPAYAPNTVKTIVRKN